jgi:hypothetical protein
VLGLICNSSEGRREVQKYDWMSSLSQGISVCLPRDPKRLFKVADYTFKGDLASRVDIWERIDKFNLQLPLNKDESEIIKLIGNLINGVTEMKALEDLRNLLQKQKQSFMNPKVFEHVLVLLSIYRFKPKARKFIFNMFEDLIFQDKMLVGDQQFEM